MPSIGKDLVKIRQQLGLSIQDIQYATKLPVHTLKKIEDDSIYSQSEEGPIYIRSFVRSYGRALKINETAMVKALDEFEAGNYQHSLLQPFPELAPAPQAQAETPKSSAAKASPKKEESVAAPSGQEKEKNTPGGQTTPPKQPQKKKAEPAAAAPAAKPKEKPIPESNVHPKNSSDHVDWAKMGYMIHQDKKPVSIWVIGLIILVIILAVAGYFILESDYFSGSDPAQEEITTPSDEPNGLSMNFNETPAAQTPVETGSDIAETLDDILFLTVYAAYGNVDPVRVWSDLKPRPDPYWIESGSAMNFEFRDEIRLNGPFDNMLLFMNGNLIETPLQQFLNEESAEVEFSRDFFASNSIWSTSVDLQLPEGVAEPDTIMNRPSF